MATLSECIANICEDDSTISAHADSTNEHRLLDSLVVECWLRVRRSRG